MPASWAPLDVHGEARFLPTVSPVGGVTDRRTPSKSRRAKADCPHHDKPRRQPRDNWDGRHAPGHMGGEFNDSGYASGRGQFGFQHDVLPPKP